MRALALAAVCLFLISMGCTHQQLAAYDRAVNIVNTTAVIAQRQEMIRQQEIANAQQRAIITQNAVALQMAQDASIKEQVREAVEKSKQEVVDEAPATRKNKKIGEQKCIENRTNNTITTTMKDEDAKIRCKIGTNPAILVQRVVCDKAQGEVLDD